MSLQVEGPVRAVSYTNMARSTRQAATMLSQAGAIMPMVIGMAGANLDAEALEPIQEVVSLLPSVGKICPQVRLLGGEAVRDSRVRYARNV